MEVLHLKDREGTDSSERSKLRCVCVYAGYDLFNLLWFGEKVFILVSGKGVVICVLIVWVVLFLDVHVHVYTATMLVLT